jgi:uncharacterized protein YndB with AHSA1/START domain
MSEVVVTRVIPVPASVVWEVVTDLTFRSSWLSEVECVEKLTAGPVTLGTRWRQTRQDQDGRAVIEEFVVVAIEPGRYVTVALVGATDRHRLTYAFIPVEVGPCRGGTIVSLVVRRQPHGFTDRLLTVLLGGFMARTVEGALRQHTQALASGCLSYRSERPAAA